MPLVRISTLKGRTPEQLRALADGVHAALVESFRTPPDDRFQILEEFEAGRLICDPGYLGVRRDEGVVVVEVTASGDRDTPTKQALYRAIADRLQAAAGVEPRNLVVVLIPNTRADWSFGEGRASYVRDEAAAGAEGAR